MRHRAITPLRGAHIMTRCKFTILTPCKFTFDATPAFDGFALGSTWNGFDDVSVTPEVRDEIAAYFRSEGDAEMTDDLLSIEPDENGLICLGGGYATRINRHDTP